VFLGGIRNIPQSLQRASMPMWAGIFYTLVPRGGASPSRTFCASPARWPTVDEKLRSFRLFVNLCAGHHHMYAMHLGQQVPVEPSRQTATI